MEVLGLDIGGANLKAASSKKQAVTIPFPLWKQPEKLTGALIDLLLRFPDYSKHGPIAVTMTGELCDCFETKASGVRHILRAAREAAGDRPLYIWRNDCKWASVDHALEEPRLVASANWLASATFAGRYLRTGPGWFFDLGSTTFDLIPLQDGKPQPLGRTDLERLNWGELAYIGASRTPICAVVDKLLFYCTPLTPAAESFATVQDVYVLKGLIAEDINDHSTADGRPRTKENARRRLARMICADVDEIDQERFDEILFWVSQEHQSKLIKAIERARQTHRQSTESPWSGVITAGSGEWLFSGPCDGHRPIGNFRWCKGLTSASISLSSLLGSEISAALCAYSVAILLAERLAK
jgi:probable H4MPT-linked C1 transfer pathway protein